MLHQLLVISSENGDLRSITLGLGGLPFQPTNLMSGAWWWRWTPSLSISVRPLELSNPGVVSFFVFCFLIFYELTAENLTKQYKSLLSEGAACSRHNRWYFVLLGPDLLLLPIIIIIVIIFEPYPGGKTTQLYKNYYQDVLCGNGTGLFVKPFLTGAVAVVAGPGLEGFHVSHEWAKVGNISMLIQRLWGRNLAKSWTGPPQRSEKEQAKKHATKKDDFTGTCCNGWL